ncbi:P-loop containing nucleoside triphosphate hydrolase [Sesbania bispinosa]|nr:P-loop containing nucleoside triphosphate hydrolase [Sesbania bispinosa]
MPGLNGLLKKGLGEMGFNADGGAINWFPGHMAAATRAILHRLKLSDLVIEVRDARIPLSSANSHLQPNLSGKRRVVALNKKDLANPNIMHEKMKRAAVGPLPGVTQDIAGFKIAHQPSIYVLDTPGVLVPSISDIETGVKLALAGSVKDSVVGEERIAQYLLAVLNTRGTPLHWKHLNNRRIDGIEYEAKENHEYNLKNLKRKRRNQPKFNGNVEDESDLENLIDQQFDALQKAMKIPHKASEARLMVSKKFLTLFRTGKLGPFILDDVPDVKPVS